jgi:hypothetical protein
MSVKQARAWLSIENLKHPPNSPNLNPLELIWGMVKIHVANILGLGDSLDALWAALQYVWNGLTEDIWKHVTAVEAAKGWHTEF